MAAIRTAKELGGLLREARRANGLTQSQVAKHLRSTQAWVSSIENGKDTAEIGQVLRMAAFVGLRLDVRAGSIGGFQNRLRRTLARHVEATELAAADHRNPADAADVDLDDLIDGTRVRS